MIKIKNIAQENNKISMLVMINGKEDNSFSLVLDADSLEELENSSGAESAYSGHARTKIYSLLKESPILPTETISYWC
ncbi:MAG: hypothetical protein IJR29_11565 [Butyrivibrio sp.]|nr:hypothetical protein [Butyrivibrio sp.]